MSKSNVVANPDTVTKPCFKASLRGIEAPLRDAADVIANVAGHVGQSSR